MNIKYLVSKEQMDDICDNRLFPNYKCIFQIDGTVFTALNSNKGVEVIAFNIDTRKASDSVPITKIIPLLNKESYDKVLSLCPCVHQKCY